jgi:protein-tyrosine kinase
MNEQTPDLIQRAAMRLQQRHGRARPGMLAGNASETMPAEPARPGRIQPSEKAFAETVLQPPGHGRHATISPATLAANGIAFPGDGSSRTTEEFRALKRYVLNNAARNGTDPLRKRVILVTSARDGEGKTFTAINLALALAFEKDVRTLLLDGDSYRRSLVAYLGISADAGWLDVVSGRSGLVLEDVLLRTNISGLSVLPSGKALPETPELMASRPMEKFLDGLLREDPARYIVIDTLPCLTSTEPSVLAGLAGQTLFVVAAHKTSREDVEASLRLLHASPNVSLVLNKAEPLLTEQFGGYGYGYAYQNRSP